MCNKFFPFRKKLSKKHSVKSEGSESTMRFFFLLKPQNTKDPRRGEQELKRERERDFFM